MRRLLLRTGCALGEPGRGCSRDSPCHHLFSVCRARDDHTGVSSSSLGTCPVDGERGGGGTSLDSARPQAQPLLPNDEANYVESRANL